MIRFSMLAVSTVLLGVSTTHALTIARDGQATSRVVVSGDAPAVTQFAAQELAQYLGRISGGQFEVVKADSESPDSVLELTNTENAVLVGLSRYTSEFDQQVADLEPDGYMIVSKPPVLLIAGNDDPRTNPEVARSLGDAGSLYGVYRFLERLGVRFYYPTEFGEVVPSRQTIELDEFSVTDAPYFRMRLAQPPIAGKPAAVWMRKLGFGATRYPQASCHSFGRWANKYKEEHPEYFALHGDRRIDHICFSHPDARAQMVKDARSWLRGHDADLYPYFTVMQNDGAPGPCRCELCKPRISSEEGWMGLQSDLVADAAVEVAESIESDFPNRGICIGAYNDYTRPPTEIDKLPENVAVCIFKHRQMFWDQQGKAGFHDVLNGWLALEPKEISFWEYYNFDCWSGAKWGGVPAVTTKLIAEDIKYLKRKSEESGVPFAGELIFCDGRLREHWPDRLWWLGLDYYISGKCLWDPDLDRESVLAEFYRTFYGPAAEPMRHFYSLAEETWNTGDFGGQYAYGNKNLKTIRQRLKASFFSADPWKHLFTAEILNTLDQHLKQAEEKATEAPYARRVQMVRDGFNWTLSQAANQKD